MIKPGEIQIKARTEGVRDQQIEKDYVLSWILQGIAMHKALSKAIVFKGGTVLKKAYFEDYRFSEDLDFYINEFIAKCESKNVNPSGFFKKLNQRLPQYKARWQKSMKDQIQDLPDFEQVEREVMRHLRKLEIIF